MSTQRLRPIERYFPTEPWLEAYRDAINASDEYADKSAGWGVDFDGSFVFQMENVPFDSNAVADLPPEIVETIKELLDRPETQLEPLLEEAPPDVRERIESRTGPLEERVTEEVLTTTLADVPDRLWPELRSTAPDSLDDLLTQLEENVAPDGTIYAYLDLSDTECRGVDTVTELDDRQYGFRLVGDYEHWKTLVGGNGDVIDMLMAGDFELDGDVQTILQYSGAAVALTEISAGIDTRFIV
ncbi:SCP2 sterol-binding domain-containing protein [Natrinema halophilum]|uniref:Sterol carrier protein n=1 Tax=Natrinema halophilum TaxID=1699371 RepID=A0A7D5GKK4_9EURY|nr:sterol carrier protein [Natrinema halophilum]QLG48732.1 sterol carrier protein [Natrinema halophilum]